jgi:hypothetical protein
VSAEALDDPDEILSSVSVLTSEPYEFAGALDNGSALRAAGDVDSSPTTKLEQSLIAKDAKRAQDRVLVDPSHGSEIARRWQALTCCGLPVGDRSADLSGDLPVKLE